MSPMPARSRVHRLLARCVGPVAFARLIEPTLADLQHEVSLAEGNTWRALRARVAGYTALVRVVAIAGVEGMASIGRLAAIAGLCAAGLVLFFVAASASDDARVVNGALLLVPVFLAPIVFRVLDGGASYRRLFMSTAAVGMLIWVGLSFRNAMPLMFIVLRLAVGVAVAVVVGAVGAAAVWSPRPGTLPFPRRIVTGLALAALVTTVLLVWRGAMGPRTGHPSIAGTVALVPFSVTLFGIVLAYSGLPVLLIARLWIRRSAWLALLGLVISPAPIFAAMHLDHQQSLADVVTECVRTPLPFVWESLPFIVGSVVLGWCLGVRTSAKPLAQRRS